MYVSKEESELVTNLEGVRCCLSELWHEPAAGASASQHPRDSGLDCSVALSPLQTLCKKEGLPNPVCLGQLSLGPSSQPPFYAHPILGALH